MLPQTIKTRVSWHFHLWQSSQEKKTMSGNPLFRSFSVFLFLKHPHQYYLSSRLQPISFSLRLASWAILAWVVLVTYFVTSFLVSKVTTSAVDCSQSGFYALLPFLGNPCMVRTNCFFSRLLLHKQSYALNVHRYCLWD